MRSFDDVFEMDFSIIFNVHKYGSLRRYHDGFVDIFKAHCHSLEMNPRRVEQVILFFTSTSDSDLFIIDFEK